MAKRDDDRKKGEARQTYARDAETKNAETDPEAARRREAELELFRRFKAVVDPDEKKALRDRIFDSYACLLGSVCSRFAGIGGLEWGDIWSAASMGLLDAIDRFDPEYGNGFSAFAMVTMNGAVMNFCRANGSSMRPPRDLSAIARRVKNESDAYYVEHGEYPTVQELAAILQIPEEKIQEAIEYKPVVSLDSFVNEGGEDGEGDDRSLIDILIGDDKFDRADLEIALREEIKKLSEFERTVIYGMYYENKTQTQIADELMTSQMTVSRTAKKAIDKLRKGLNG